jgi:cytochrome P450
MAMAIPRLEGHPIIGHLTTFRNDRIGMMKRLATEQRDIVQMPLGFVRQVMVITSPVLANEVLTTKQSAFMKAPGLTLFLRPVLGDGLLTSETSVHERQRKLLAPAFAHKRIASYAATMTERAGRFAGRLRDGESFDLAEEMMRLTFEIVGKTLFDAEVIDDARAVGRAITTAMEVAMKQLGALFPVPPNIPTPTNLRYRRAVAELDEVIYRIIRERRAEGGDRGDVLSMLLEAKDEAGTPMTDRQVRDEAMTLFLAGHETTANALSWTFYLLARHPDVRAWMESDIDRRAPAVFKEAMRLFPPAYLVGRRALEDVMIGDHLVTKGAIVLVNIVGIHRRSDLWADPERFDPERFVDDKDKQLPRCTYLPFGAGPRICIGNHFALLEGQILLSAIARRAHFELSGAEVEPEPLVTMRPRGGLPARVRIRN